MDTGTVFSAFLSKFSRGDGKKIQKQVECEAFVQIDSARQPELKFIRRNEIRQRLAIKISFMLIFIASGGHM